MQPFEHPYNGFDPTALQATNTSSMSNRRLDYNEPPYTQSLDGSNATALQLMGTLWPSAQVPPDFHQSSMQSFASHAARHPLQPIIPPNQRPAEQVTRASRHAAQVIRQQQRADFLQDLTEFQESQSKAITDLATKYHRKPLYMKKVLMGETHYKKRRATNLYNAKIAYNRREFRDVGKTSVKLRELHLAVEADPSLHDLTPEREAELISLLEAEKSVKNTGATFSNRAAAHDYRSTIGRIGEEITSLESRTGATAFAFFSRSHINDSMQPVWVASNEALDFLSDSMQTSAGEMGRKLELWACSKDDRKTKGELKTLQSECSETISQKLKEIVNCRNAKMSYQYYETEVRQRYKVQLRGWPASVRFIAPGKITTLYEIRALHEALHTGGCFWVSMSRQESADLSKKLAERPLVKKRKPKRIRDENGTAGPSQGKRRNKVRSASVVESDGKGGE